MSHARDNEKTPLEDAITEIFQAGARVQKEINSLKGAETEEDKARLSDLVHRIQPNVQETLERHQGDLEDGRVLGWDNPW
ncbi:hypothetical protein BJAS_P4701 [Bathymodiolus japonicus methanotrophic gill symbiont]|uniref:hypothetical protein n=1 Tax=Bathymodiolus japonicus methanotrophic gill symbiont TaxID=113269 RepID=UPI001B7B401D|nr:hypothetical protein [Bathymodiolus japonicus methanotrophic gill symbiont]GFO73717.1 hypothetical protein BJAS_P4701 [Bathymodiolus japonicus methanotrophic gill symbiont]